LIIWIVILLLLIGTITAAYFGARLWHWFHVTLFVFVFLAAVGYFVLAAEVLRINAVLRKQANQLETQLAGVKADIDALDRGTRKPELIGSLSAQEVAIPEGAEEVPSLADLEHDLHLVTRLRGRVWRNVAPAGFDPKTGSVAVTIQTPQPSGLAPDTIMYLFEQGPAPTQDAPGAQYLGEFRVAEVTGQQAKLVSVNQFDEFEQNRINNSRGPWVLHETMPIDRNELYAGLKEEQLRKILPADSVEEYIRQGSPAGPDDDEWHVIGFDEEGNQVGPNNIDKAVKKVYQRRLRDYVEEFADLHRRRVLLLANIGAVQQDNERLKQSLASAKGLEEFRTEEIRKLGIDLAGVKKEREIIDAHLGTVQQQLAHAQQLLKEAIAENRRLAEELAQRDARYRERGGSREAAGPLALTP
jgi:hypothetical protein